MSEAVVDDIVAVLPPLLQSLEALGFVARHLNPPDFGRVMEAAGTPDEALRAVRPQLSQWPAEFNDIRTALETASDAALAAFAGLREVQNGNGDLVSVFRSLRYSPRAQEALYALVEKLPPVSEFFVEPSLREDADLAARLAQPANENTGIFHDHNEPGSRGGFSLYVPEYYTPDRAWPLVMALHGGSGNGRGFLWSWLRDARSHGAILIAPTATGNASNSKSTWALMGEDTDTPNLMRILEQVRSRWNIDATKMLLTGMSDGGTFCYVSGLESASPFTHLAPVSATFHPLMAEMADAERLRGLPIHLVHGKLDWMFPVQVARQTRQLLSAAGAKVAYRELDDLSHTYPREMNAPMLAWLRGE
ncbi:MULTISPECIES: phospholipase [unclassified Bradyrhizobium]|uniref:carboxylesterase family protein n=1 Tax=unclassified Bradyrhizobium TaxID=2631580 RepID=UPI001BACF686|nr:MULTISPECIES: phospholipase [unclassified Bradyrhizobium]MBR1229786.1 phospholipase [Bradyrhizobium sp. AUGA SZCCT0176]MBR1302123.1 phospholipase [Bradyrhizobium sp. AUGA SZCCT0042]